LTLLPDHVRELPLIVSATAGVTCQSWRLFTEAFTRPGTGVLYWCGMDGAEVPNVVRALIGAAETPAHSPLRSTLGFDDLVTRLARHCLDGCSRERARRSWCRPGESPFCSQRLYGSRSSAGRSSRARLRDPVSPEVSPSTSRSGQRSMSGNTSMSARARMKSWPSR